LFVKGNSGFSKLKKNNDLLEKKKRREKVLDTASYGLERTKKRDRKFSLVKERWSRKLIVRELVSRNIPDEKELMFGRRLRLEDEEKRAAGK